MVYREVFCLFFLIYGIRFFIRGKIIIFEKYRLRDRLIVLFIYFISICMVMI